MNLDELRKFQQKRPFQPFDIILVDRRTFHVPHPDFIWVPPGRGTWVYVHDPKSDAADHVNTAIISSIRTASSGKRRKAG